MTLFYNVTTNHPPEKYVLFMFLCSKKHQTATGTLFTITPDYSLRTPLGQPCF